MDCQKDKFSLQTNVHYLNCAYKAPLLKAAEESCLKALIRERNPFLIGIDDFFDITENIKSEFGKLVNCLSSDIAIIPSTSYGFSTILKNINGKKDGKAIIGMDEFPSGYFALKHWTEIENQTLKVATTNEDILNEISENTSVVLISAVHWQNGYAYDLLAIGDKCEKVGAYLIVDGTQSVGALSIDVEVCKIHALICATYKWLFGPYSLCIAYIHKAFHTGQPLEEAWMNRTNYKAFGSLADYVETYRPSAGRFNVGETSNFILSPILLEGLKQVNKWGASNIQTYCKNLKDELILGLENLNLALPNKQSANHIFSINLPEKYDIQKVQHSLKEDNVFVSVRKGSIRISINVFNDKVDIRKFLEVLEN